MIHVSFDSGHSPLSETLPLSVMEKKYGGAVVGHLLL